MTEPTPQRASMAFAVRLAGLLRASFGVMGRVVSVVAPWLWRQRGIIVGLGARATWWIALVMWWTCAIALAGTERVDLQASLRSFAIGAVLCALVVAIAGVSRHMRHLQWAGGVLGSLHGVCGVVLWTVLSA